MDDQGTNRASGWRVKVSQEFKDEIDSILKACEAFDITREPLNDNDRMEIRELVERMEKFKQKYMPELEK
jgi:hypothetical protein